MSSINNHFLNIAVSVGLPCQLWKRKCKQNSNQRGTKHLEVYPLPVVSTSMCLPRIAEQPPASTPLKIPTSLASFESGPEAAFFCA